MDLITSRSNSKIKAARSLRQSKKRRESGMFLVEGIRHVGEAAASAMSGSGYHVDAIFYAPDLLSSDFAQDLILVMLAPRKYSIPSQTSRTRKASWLLSALLISSLMI